MKKSLSKSETQKQIDAFFQRHSWSPDELRKICRLAMKHRIRLGSHRKRFCKYCSVPLSGKLRISKNHKVIVCSSCGAMNRHILRSA